MVAHVRTLEKFALAALSASAIIAATISVAATAPLGLSLSNFTTVVEDAKSPEGWIQFCKRHPDDCRAGNQQLQVPTLTDERLAELERINLAVNRRIKPRTDIRNYGVKEWWTYPDNGYGDCEDYALLKRRMLAELGWPLGALLITIVWSKNAGHSVLLVRTDEGEYVLDNMRSEVLLWSKTRYDFVKRQSEDDPNKWVYIDGRTQIPATVAGR